MRKSTGSHRGFSLLEICISMAIVAVLLAIGIPIFNRSKSNKLLKSTVDVMVADLKQGRTLSLTAPSSVAFVEVSGSTVSVSKRKVGNGVNSIATGGSNSHLTANSSSVAATPQARVINQYSVVQVDNVVKKVAFDPTIKVSYIGGNGSSDAPCGVVLGSDDGIFFNPDGTVPPAVTTNTKAVPPPTAVVLTNGLTQFRVSVSPTGEVTATEEPVGTQTVQVASK